VHIVHYIINIGERPSPRGASRKEADARDTGLGGGPQVIPSKGSQPLTKEETMTKFAIFDTANGFLQAVVEADDAVSAAQKAMADISESAGDLFSSYSRREATGPQTYIEPVMIAYDASDYDTSEWDAESGWPDDFFDKASRTFIYDRASEDRLF